MGKVKCLECGRILESKYRHDFVECGCPNNTFVDGGNDYLRFGGIDGNKIVILDDDNNPIAIDEQLRQAKENKPKDEYWIQTYTGKTFFYNNPQEKDISILDIAHSLSLQCRFNGHAKTFYSVAQHSVLASENVLPGAAMWGLLHDAAEAYISDIPRPLKHMPQLKVISGIEDNIMKVIASKFGLVWPMPTDIQRIDDELVFAEQKELLCAPSLEWKLSIKPKLNISIHPVTAVEAEAMFLRRYEVLMEGA